MVSRSERRRRLARERWERQQRRREEQHRRSVRRRKALLVGTAVALVAGGLVWAIAWVRGGDDDVTALAEDTPSAEASPDSDSATPDGTCAWTETGSPAVEGIEVPPAEPVAAEQAAQATITLDGSPVTVQLLPEQAPCTVSSLAHLASSGFFDGTTCHRLTASATLDVLQCGDPTGTGSGGPGYQFPDENLEGAAYPAGTLAMANAGPGTNGSQFFLVYADSELPPSYTVFGTVTEGLDVVTAIAERGTADGGEDGAPAQPVTIDSLVVTGA
ncbi:MAG TPA: peptidylprolyl isomerase [Jiangellales bacterium]|nr:peptidylprolyl isomerase [Jiangellales bacterium]